MASPSLTCSMQRLTIPRRGASLSTRDRKPSTGVSPWISSRPWMQLLSMREGSPNKMREDKTRHTLRTSNKTESQARLRDLRLPCQRVSWSWTRMTNHSFSTNTTWTGVMMMAWKTSEATWTWPPGRSYAPPTMTCQSTNYPSQSTCDKWQLKRGRGTG